MSVRWIASGTTYANSFVYGDVLVDAGVLPMAVQPYAGVIETIVITHAHYDHIAHIKEIARICNDATVCIHEGTHPASLMMHGPYPSSAPGRPESSPIPPSGTATGSGASA